MKAWAINAMILGGAILSIVGGIALLRARSEAARLDRDIVLAEREMLRLEYVIRRHDELVGKQGDIEVREDWSRRARAVLDGDEAPVARPVAIARPDWPGVQPALGPARDPWTLGEAIDARRRRLDEMNATISRGLNLEKLMSATEQDVAAADARLAALQAERDDLTAQLATRGLQPPD